MTTTDLTAGLTLVDDITTASEGLRNGDWLSASLGSLSVGASFMDPIGTLFEQGIGWILEHLQPLSGWLDQLTGDPDQVLALAQSWSGISDQLLAAADDLFGMVRGDLAEFEGMAVDVYRQVQGANVSALESLADMAASISGALEASSNMVQTVHDLVRDTISMIVGAVLAALATAWIPVYGQVRLGTEVAELVAKYVPDIRRVIDSLKSAFGLLQDLLKRAGDALRALRSKLAKFLPSGGGSARAADNVDELAHLRQWDEAAGAYRLNDPIDVEFDPKDYDRAEYGRQLADQEAGMNELTVEDFVNNRDQYLEEGRTGNDAQRHAYKAEVEARTKERIRNGEDPETARKLAEDSLVGQHALHNPDQVAGGNPDNIGGFGDGPINQSIGAQWRSRIGPVDEQVRGLSEAMTPEQRASTLLNMSLNMK